MKRSFQIVLAFLMLPVCWGVGQGLWTLAKRFRDVPEGSFYFLAGFFIYFFVQWVFFRPMRTYVFGHELTHALAAWMSGGSVKHFHVSKKGGSVTVTKTNIFVSLAPYMIPLYSLVLVGGFFAASFVYDLYPFWKIFLALLGASLAFHVSLTLYALQQHQPDLKTAGQWLSGVLIFLGNAGFLVFLLGILFPKTVSWNAFVRASGQETVRVYQRLGQGVYGSFHRD